jgi:tetratricopeptide (TPR) repeat protein
MPNREPTSSSPLGRAALALASLSAFASVLAEDIVELYGTGRVGVVTVKGDLVRHDERGVILRTGNRDQRYEPERIKSVKTKFLYEHEKGEEALRKQDHARAVTLFNQALQTENRVWAVSRIRAGLIRALTATGAIVKAGEEFLQLSADETEPEIMALAPLIWSTAPELNDADRQTALRWLGDANRPIRSLLAASWLLESGQRAGARDALRKLETSDDPRGLAWLARAQSLRLADEKTDAADLRRFEDLLLRIPPSVRNGPRFALAGALERRGDHAGAAITWLWIPFVHGKDSDLAPEALVRAGSAAAKAGLVQDADRLFAEAVTKYPGTTWAIEAEKRRKAVAGPAGR